jgi:anti-sigma regulatory factor (Ser/Thr protein kinase)
MTVPSLVALRVHDATQAAEARRLVRALAMEVGLPTEVAGRAELVATEAVTNLVKHAGGGDVILRAGRNGDDPAIDFLAIDRGPGMANLAACLRDGYSSAGTPGTGLGAIVRQSTFFDAYSRPDGGTIVLSRIAAGRGRTASAPPGLVVDGLALQKHGEEVCGDAWAARTDGRVTTILVADGLGHGLTAADAAREAVATFQADVAAGPVATVDRIHRALMKTRGAAIAVASIDASQARVTYAGAGNIAATIEDDRSARHLVSVHGTAGHQVRRLQEFSYPWTPDAILVMHSDGVSAHWSLGAYPGLQHRHPAVIAAVLLRDFSRGRDDATVVVARTDAGGER